VRIGWGPNEQALTNGCCVPLHSRQLWGTTRCLNGVGASWEQDETHETWTACDIGLVETSNNRAVEPGGTEMAATSRWGSRTTISAVAPSGSGFQVSLYGLAGFLIAAKEGFELNLLGLNIGVDAAAPALKLPAIGRLGGPRK
jgi:hypothetical protein